MSRRGNTPKKETVLVQITVRHPERFTKLGRLRAQQWAARCMKFVREHPDQLNGNKVTFRLLSKGK